MKYQFKIHTCNANSWSSIREISGEITNVIPSLKRAGYWKHKDLP